MLSGGRTYIQIDEEIIFSICKLVSYIHFRKKTGHVAIIFLMVKRRMFLFQPAFNPSQKKSWHPPVKGNLREDIQLCCLKIPTPC